MSIVGFGDVDFRNLYLTPTLTHRCALPCPEMGYLRRKSF